MNISPNNLAGAALRGLKKSAGTVLLFSAVVNVLLLTVPIFMLQVYDRVLLSRSEETLIFLVVVAVFALVLMLALEVIRQSMMIRIASRFDRDLAAHTYAEVVGSDHDSLPLQHVSQIRNFTSSPYLLALFDIPWTPLYIGLVFLLHPWLGYVGIVGALILFCLAVFNDLQTRFAFRAGAQGFASAGQFMEHTTKHKDSVLGMGMLPSLTRIWSFRNNEGLGYHAAASARNTVFSAMAKVIRQGIQIAVLAFGAYLAITDVTTPGVMIAASIILSRALAPIEQSIQGWRSLTRVREASDELLTFFESRLPQADQTTLPVPEGHISLSNVIVLGDELDSGQRQPILTGLTLSLKAGDVIGLTGASGAGKSTIARAILGITQPESGEVRIDGARMSPETAKQFSAYFGYLPQDVELFDGTVAQNIARFNDGEDSDVVAAAKLAQAHELILSLPKGYETEVGPMGAYISGGQRQRIGLARAIYGRPKLLILDEPTSNLDSAGFNAFTQFLEHVKTEGTTTIVIGHHLQLFKSVDKVAFLADGKIDRIEQSESLFRSAQANEPKTDSKPKARSVVKSIRKI